MASAHAKAKNADIRERVVLYARISEDSTGEGAGVARQMEDLRALAKVRDWQVAGEIADNNVSAFTGTARPGYKQVLAMVTGREVDRVAVWHMSRLWRNRTERAKGLESFRESGVSIADGPPPLNVHRLSFDRWGVTPSDESARPQVRIGHLPPRRKLCTVSLTVEIQTASTSPPGAN
jgi:hypothetical protein